MRKAVTVKLLDSLRARSNPYEIRDTKLSGFLVRVQPSGAVSFIVQLGRAKRVTLGRYPGCTLERARKLYTKAVAAAEEGASTSDVKALVRPDTSAPATLATFLEDTYETWLEKHRKTGAAEAARIKAAFPDLLDTPLMDITTWSIERWRTERRKQGSKPSTINRDLNTLRACVRRAAEWGVIDSYTLGGVKPLKVDSRGVVRYLSPEEETALRAALDARKARKEAARASGNQWRATRGGELLPNELVDHLAPMVLLSLNTGLRRGELFALRWCDLDLERRTLTVAGASTKSGTTRHIPLSDEAAEVLADWKEQAADKDGLIFPGKEGRPFHTLKTSWAKLLVDAGISNFRWHDMRHTFASKLVQAGVDLNTVRELMGHADIKMTLRYAHLAPSHLAGAVAKLKPAIVTNIAGQQM